MAMFPSHLRRLPAKTLPLRLVLAGLFTLFSAACAFGAHKAPPAKPAVQYVAHDTHPSEHVTIAADPCDQPSHCSFFRIEYIRHGFLPVRVIVTNDGDQPLSLDDVRIQFISADNDVIPAATDEELNRRLFNPRQALGTRIPLTPIPITIHHKSVDKKITQDLDDFGFHSTTVQPHSTLAGYLLYDIHSLDDPALRHAQLYVKEIYTLHPRKQLFAFTIPFDIWLKANPSSPLNLADQ